MRQSNLSTWKSTWTELGRLLGKKITKWHFHSTSKEDSWPKKISNFMQGLKCANLAIFQRGPGWLCSVSVALKNPLLDLKKSFCFRIL